MSTSNHTEILLGCDPQVRVVIIEDAGNLMLEVYAQDPENTDIDGLFLNLTDPSIAGDLNVYPAFDEAIGSNGENVTGIDIQTGALNQLNNGAQVQDQYDVKLEFGEIAYTSYGDVDEAKFTFWVEGSSPLTADSIDLSNMTAVINSDHGQNGLALTGGIGGGESGGTIYQTSVAASESFDSSGSGWTWWGWHDATRTGDDVVRNDWDLKHGEAMTNGGNDGVLALAPVDSDGPVTMSFDIRAEGLHNFEGGTYGDSLKVQVRLDNGDWQTLDTFIIDEHTDTFTGDQTGQTFAGQSTTLNYSGGVLDTVDGTAQFRLVSNISACDEKLFIDDIEITVSEEVPAEGEKTVIMDEDFDSLWSLDHSQNVIRDDGWNAEDGQAMTSGWNDGMLKFAEVATSDPVELTMDMRAEGLRYFENDNDWGCIADSLRVEVQIDGGDWVLLDEFQVNDAGTAMVGSLTGQTFNGDMTGLSYSGGVLDTASDDVQVRLVSDISSSNEQIYVDNVQIVSVADADDAKEDLLVNGDLESHTPAGHVYVNNQVQGWTNDNGAIETWGTGAEGQEASSGTSFIELDRHADDRVDNLYQDVQTDDGRVYTLDFDAAQRGADSDSIEIYWNDELVRTVSPEDEDWESFSVNVTGTGGLDRIEFRELAAENDSTGPLLDNISLTAADNGDTTCGQYDVTYDDVMTQQLTPEEVAEMLAAQEAEEGEEELEEMMA